MADALAALLARAGAPWYAAMLAEAGLESLAALRCDDAAAALADAGVEPRHVDAILERLRTDDAAAADAAAADASRAPAAPGAPGAAAAAPTTSGAGCAAFTRGGLYCPAFLAAAAPLYEQHMGAENMGPLLYSLVRFTKPAAILELGAGFTSIFLLQALADNAAEAAAADAAAASGALAGVPWLAPGLPQLQEGLAGGTLHVVDNLAHEHTSAHRVAAAATSLGVRERLVYHDADALDSDLPSRLAPNQRHFGLVWIDLGAAHRLGALVDAWWPRVAPQGGMLLVHSTLTNQAGRAWLARMRAASAAAEADEADADDAGVPPAGGAACGGSHPYGRFELLSLLEPHKRFQNSVTALRRRGGGPGGCPLWDEPLFSKWP
jgi:hypothetical protein